MRPTVEFSFDISLRREQLMYLVSILNIKLLNLENVFKEKKRSLILKL